MDARYWIKRGFVWPLPARDARHAQHFEVITLNAPIGSVLVRRPRPLA
jgi:hypothetical protein